MTDCKWRLQFVRWLHVQCRRLLSPLVDQYAAGFPVVGIFGQSGKTTLAGTLFPDRPYVSLENLDTREFAEADARGFLAQHKSGALFDEIQNVPALLSYLQQLVDESSAIERYIITGSLQYRLRREVSQSLGDDAGISHNTARGWLNVLDAGFIVHRLQPYHRSFNKRLIKSPKLYFVDSGLAAYLLSIHDLEQAQTHPLRGPLFETAVVSEYLKHSYKSRSNLRLSYWQERSGQEVDLILETPQGLTPVEIKSGVTVTRDMFRSLRRWAEVAGAESTTPTLVYGGSPRRKRSDVTVQPWHSPLA